MTPDVSSWPASLPIARVSPDLTPQLSHFIYRSPELYVQHSIATSFFNPYLQGPRGAEGFKGLNNPHLNLMHARCNPCFFFENPSEPSNKWHYKIGRCAHRTRLTFIISACGTMRPPPKLFKTTGMASPRFIGFSSLRYANFVGNCHRFLPRSIYHVRMSPLSVHRYKPLRR